MTDNVAGGFIRLAAVPNFHDWGRMMNDSFIDSLTAQACSPDFDIDPEEFYSELWMGTHPTFPSRLYFTGELLSEYLTRHPELLGNAFSQSADTSERTNNVEAHIPFLLKILCCRQALPVQVNLDVELARYVHKENAEQSLDLRQKPEIVICLSNRFLGFASFRSTGQIQTLLRATPEIQLLSDGVKEAVNSLMDHAFDVDQPPGGARVERAWKAILESDNETVKEAALRFKKRVQSDGFSAFHQAGLSDQEIKHVTEAVDVLDEYGHADVVIFASLMFLNIIELETGEGMYVGADVPHAWLGGDIVEILATSDNILDVGLNADRDSIAITTHSAAGVAMITDPIKLNRSPWTKGQNGNVQVYRTPFKDFSILHCSGDDVLNRMSGPGIAVVTQGSLRLSAGTKGGPAEIGSVFFIPANTELIISGEGNLWMAFYHREEAGAGPGGA